MLTGELGKNTKPAPTRSWKPIIALYLFYEYQWLRNLYVQFKPKYLGYSSQKNNSFSASRGELDYYFIYETSFKEIIHQYTLLTGTSPLLPRAAMGLHVALTAAAPGA